MRNDMRIGLDATGLRFTSGGGQSSRRWSLTELWCEEEDEDRRGAVKSKIQIGLPHRFIYKAR